MLNLKADVTGEGDIPDDETVSTRWGVRILAGLFVVNLAALFGAEFISASKIADMQHTVQVCSEVLRGASYGISVALGIDRGVAAAAARRKAQ